jgi:hypothetical protein
MRRVGELVLFSLCLAAIFLLWGSGVGQPAQASSAAQAPTPTRPPMQPLPTPTSAVTPKPGLPPEGGLIELWIYFAPKETLWTIVQWQDGLGNWHDVEGWRGAPDQDDKVIWWVASSDLGKGPFRWMVYQGQDGKLIAKSETFYLPHQAGEVVKVLLRP